jgi:uncharacterized membrane-anchored protein
VTNEIAKSVHMTATHVSVLSDDMIRKKEKEKIMWGAIGLSFVLGATALGMSPETITKILALFG